MPFTYQRTVRFSDTDAAGVVYFANVLSICHEAYEASLEKMNINLREFFGNSPLAFPVLHGNVDFFRPMYCGDRLIIKMMPQQLGREKFEINYELVSGEVIVSKALTRHVCIEVATRSKQELPAKILNWLEVYRRGTENSERDKLRRLM